MSSKGKGEGCLAEGLRAEERTLQAREACAVLCLHARPKTASAKACLKETMARLRLLWQVRANHPDE